MRWEIGGHTVAEWLGVWLVAGVLTFAVVWSLPLWAGAIMKPFTVSYQMWLQDQGNAGNPRGR